MSRKAVLIVTCVVSLIFLAGCMEEKVSYTYGTVGKVEVRGDVDKIAILNYSVESVIYKNYTMQMVKGFVYHDKTHRYEIRGIARNIAGENISKAKICVTFYRQESKMLKPLVSKCHIKQKISPNETWTFKVKYLFSDPGFGKVDKIDFWVEVS